ncbi:MAG: hypothetical protein HGA85_06230 [Nanoarchaeota archaeon]|nr:hypothetical protein [Nanoarchaeota archaeon]
MLIKEGLAEVEISDETKISKKLEVFYNPVMKHNRDISVLLLSAVPDKEMQIADIMAGTGIRSIRFAKELPEGKIKYLAVNDYSSSERIKANMARNGLPDMNVFSQDANLFLLNSKGFDYIEVDPFGTPNPFLDSSILRLARNGILAVTATDTSALAGSSRTACTRKYWAKPLKNELMHELGLRILIRKVQLIGAQYEKALLPIYSYSKDHYMRAYFRCEKGRQKADEIMKEHRYFLYDLPDLSCAEVPKPGHEYAGPLWTGQLWDPKLAKAVCDSYRGEDKELMSFLGVIAEEAQIPSVGFYDIVKLAKIRKVKVKKIEPLLSSTCKRTHFLGWGLRSTGPPF